MLLRVLRGTRGKASALRTFRRRHLVYGRVARASASNLEHQRRRRVRHVSGTSRPSHGCSSAYQERAARSPARQAHHTARRAGARACAQDSSSYEAQMPRRPRQPFPRGEPSAASRRTRATSAQSARPRRARVQHGPGTRLPETDASARHPRGRAAARGQWARRWHACEASARTGARCVACVRPRRRWPPGCAPAGARAAAELRGVHGESLLGWGWPGLGHHARRTPRGAHGAARACTLTAGRT